MLQCKEWWDQHLKNQQTKAMEAPLLRVYLQDMIPPSGSPPDIRTGRWIEMNGHQTGQHKVLIPDGNSGKLLPQTDDKLELREATQIAYPSTTCGLVMCDWISYGDNSEAADQRLADAYSLSWTSDVLQDDINILGNPELNCLISADKDQACLATRLLHVFPDGRSTLITFGVLNLTHRDGHAIQDIKPLIPGEKYSVKVEMRAISYVVPRGHRIRLAVSPTFFPMIWPSRETTTLEVVTGCKNDTVQTSLKIPIFPSESIPPESGQIMNATERPRLGPELPNKILRPARYCRHSVYGLSEPVHKYVVDVDYGRVHLFQTDTIMDSHLVNTYSIEEGKPLSAVALVEGYVKIEYPNIDGGIVTCADLSSQMWSDYAYFYTDSTLVVSLNGDEIHKKKWEKRIPRFYV